MVVLDDVPTNETGAHAGEERGSSDEEKTQKNTEDSDSETKINESGEESSDGSNDDSENDSLTDSGKRRRKNASKASAKAKGKNFNSSEDALLSRAWVYRLQNAIKGSDQKGDVFWSSIHATYVQLLKESYMHLTRPLRNKKSLQNRWRRTINPEVQFFCGVWSIVRKEYHLGWNNTDYTEAAMSLYQRRRNREFKLKDSWIVLRQNPKFNSQQSATLGEGSVSLSASKKENQSKQSHHLQQKLLM